MGRPREFEPDAALDAIKQAFWRGGYEGTSMHDIEAATGLKKQSLYRLFGDKRQIYLKALAHYEQNEVQAAARLLLEERGSAAARFERLFAHTIDEALGSGDRRGCFLCNAATDQAQLDAPTRAIVASMMTRVHAVYMKALSVSDPYRTSRAQRQRKASHLLALYNGLRVLIKANAPETMLREAARSAIESI